jgi:hypothetical protein
MTRSAIRALAQGESNNSARNAGKGLHYRVQSRRHFGSWFKVQGWWVVIADLKTMADYHEERKLKAFEPAKSKTKTITAKLSTTPEKMHKCWKKTGKPRETTMD